MAMVVLVILLFGGYASAEESQNDGGTTTLDNDSSQQQGQSLSFSDNRVNKDNTSIGSWIYPGGIVPGLPDIPLSWQLSVKQYNESTPQEIFSAMPEVITRKHLATYRETMKEEMGSWDRGKLERNLNRRSFTWVKDLPKKNSLRVFPSYPNSKDSQTGRYIAIKDRDYRMIAKLNFNAEDEIVQREDLACSIIEWAMDKGADALIVTGWGARRVFDTKAGALSLLTAFGKIFTSANPYGFNVSPGGGYTSGSNQTETLPYLHMAAVQVVDKDKFLAGMSGQSKSVQEIPDQLEPLREQIEQRKTDIMNCPTANLNNAGLRYAQGIDYLVLATNTREQAEYNSALVVARDNFAQALRDGARGQQAQEINGHLAAIWYAMGMQVEQPKRGPYFQKAQEYAVKAGIEEIPVLQFQK